MKASFSILVMLVLTHPIWAADITAIRNGSWTANSTWNLNRIPINNDVVIIPDGKTVMLAAAPYPKNNPAERPTLQIKIYGTLDFSDPGNDKLYLHQGSTIQIFAGGKIMTTSNNPEIVAIYNGTADNTVWSGDPSIINGPVAASSTSLGFAGSLLTHKYIYPATIIEHNIINTSPLFSNPDYKILQFPGLRASENEQIHVYIFDFAGRMITSRLFNNNNSVSLSSVPPGGYIVRLKGTRGFNLVKKIIVK